jgi:hypothetical protein
MKSVFRHCFLCIVCLLGCSYGFSIRSNVARVSDEAYESHEGPIDVFFEGTKPEKEYIQIALIELKGGRGYEESSSDALLKTIKEEAQRLGADAIINVKVTPMTREGSYSLFGGEEKHYSTIFMTGIAIKYKTYDEE